jgi:hypothetical protein
LISYTQDADKEKKRKDKVDKEQAVSMKTLSFEERQVDEEAEKT